MSLRRLLLALAALAFLAPATAQAVESLPGTTCPWNSIADRTVIIETSTGHGSGHHITGDLILTAAHVVKGHKMVKVASGTIMTAHKVPYLMGVEAKVIATDPATDLALLRLTKPLPGPAVKTLKVADRLLHPGEAVAYFGLHRENVVTAKVTHPIKGREGLLAIRDPRHSTLHGDSGAGIIACTSGELVGVVRYTVRPGSRFAGQGLGPSGPTITAFLQRAGIPFR